MTNTQRNNITGTIPESLLIYNTDTHCFESYYNAVWVAMGCTACQLPGAFSASAASSVASTSFSANWTASAGATTYYLDVATNAGFTTFVTGYTNLNVGNVTTYSVNTNLTCNNTYYYRLRANNACGTSSNSNLITQATGACVPQCGTQIWATTNLNAGTMITSDGSHAGQQQTNNGTTEKYCYQNIEANCTTYGGLYEWGEAVKYVPSVSCDPCGPTTGHGGTVGQCPSGYHVPSDLEWARYAYCLDALQAPTDGNSGTNTLSHFQTTFGWTGSSTAGVGPGDKMKTIGYGSAPLWGSGNNGTNTSNFAALPAGWRGNATGGFAAPGGETDFWTATLYNSACPDYWQLTTGESRAYHYCSQLYIGYTVRCLQD